MTFMSFFKPVLMAGGLLLAQNAYAGHFLYANGSDHALDAERLGMLGFTFEEFHADEEGWWEALHGEYGSFDAIVVGEHQGSHELDLATQETIASYVSQGGRIVVINDHEAATDFVNDVFDYSLIDSYTCEDSEDVGGNLQVGTANRTGFVSGTAQLRNLSCTAALELDSLPTGAKSIYTGNGTTLAFTSKFGSGQFAWLGWDFCLGFCNTIEYANQWYHVLATAVSPGFKVCLGAGYSGTKALVCQMACEVRQSPSVKNALVAGFMRLYREKPTCAVDLPLDEFQGEEVD